MTREGRVIPFRRNRRPTASGAAPSRHEQAAAGSGADSGGGEPDRMANLLHAVARQGDRDAFAALFRHFAPRVKAYLQRAGGEADGVDDVLQDVFATIWRKAGLYDSRRASAAAWIFAIARNRRIDAFRRQRRPEFDAEDPAFRPAPPVEGEEAVAVRQRTEAVRAALARLSDEQRAVLQLSFYRGESYADIAVRLGIPIGTVKSRARLAFRRLRDHLGPQGEGLR